MKCARCHAVLTDAYEQNCPVAICGAGPFCPDDRSEHYYRVHSVVGLIQSRGVDQGR